MKKTLMAWVLGILGFVVVLQLLGLPIMNGQKQNVSAKTGAVWVQVQRASDLLPRLEQQLNVTIKLQKDLIDKITAARSDILAAEQSNDPAAILKATDNTQIALKAFVENYPNLGLPELQQGLLDETSGSFNRIAYAREQLIEAQQSYNTTRIWFPLLYGAYPEISILGSNVSPLQTVPPSNVGK